MEQINFENLYWKSVKRYCENSPCSLKKMLVGVKNNKLTPLEKDELVLGENTFLSPISVSAKIKEIITRDFPNFAKIIGKKLSGNLIVQKNIAGQTIREFYSEDGDVLQSIKEYDPKTGKIIRETYFYNDGKTVHDLIEYDPETGNIVKKEQYNGEDVIIYDKTTGKIQQSKKYYQGNLSSIDYFDKDTGRIIKREYYNIDDETGKEYISNILEWSPWDDKLCRNDCFYPNGQLVNKTKHDALGKKESAISFYSNGKVSSNTVFDKRTGNKAVFQEYYEDETVLKSESIYDSDTKEILTETKYRKDHSKELTYIYEDNDVVQIKFFDENNNCIKIKNVKKDYGFSHLSDSELRDIANDYIQNSESKSVSDLSNIYNELQRRNRHEFSSENCSLSYDIFQIMTKKFHDVLLRLGDYEKEMLDKDNVDYDEYMNKEEARVVFDYYDNCPHNIGLRKGTLSKKDWKEVAIMDQGLKKCPPLSQDAIMYRAVNGCDDPHYSDIQEFIENIKPGYVFTDKAYVSVATRSYGACMRQFGNGAICTDGYIFRIKLPKGTKIAMNRDEGVLPRNSQFKVINVQNIDGVKVADLEYILPEE